MQDDRSASSIFRLPNHWNRFFLRIAAGMAALLSLAACNQVQAPPPAASIAPVARLLIINDGGSEWAITATAVDGEARAWHLSPQATLGVDLPAGDYTIEQTLLADEAAPDASRRFSMALDAGQFYRWRLVNLLSQDAADQMESLP